MKNRLQSMAVVGLMVCALAACGGGGGGGSGSAGTQPQSSTAQGTMTRTSASAITVNGVSFDVGGASIRIDDRAGTAAELRSGMNVRVRGSDDGNGRGRANEVEVENEVRGAVTAVSAATMPQFFNIGNVKVVVDSTTVYDDLVPASFAAIQVGVFLEVHGARDTRGTLVATRIEGKGARNAGAPEVDELRGFIAAVNAGVSQFTLGSVTVSFTPATLFTPASRCSPASLAAGLEVEVHGAFTAANAFAATRIDCEHMEDESRHAGHGEHASLEGFVAGLDPAARAFTIRGQQVSYSTTTQFRGGTVDDLANNVRVEVEGTMSGTTLVAREIRFKRTRVILTAVPSAVGGNTLTLFGRVVQVTDATEIRAEQAGGGNSTALTDIAANTDRVEVRAFVDGGSLFAERVTEIGNSGGGRDVVQARVVAENEVAQTLGLLDAANPLNAALTGAQFRNTADQPISATQFFAAVVPASAGNPGTLVKVKGRFAGATLVAEEAELED